MIGITLTRDLAWAAATDAGNRSMRRAGRTAWNEDDWNAACEALDLLRRAGGLLTDAEKDGASGTVDET